MRAHHRGFGYLTEVDGTKRNTFSSSLSLFKDAHQIAACYFEKELMPTSQCCIKVLHPSHGDFTVSQISTSKRGNPSASKAV